MRKMKSVVALVSTVAVMACQTAAGATAGVSTSPAPVVASAATANPLSASQASTVRSDSREAAVAAASSSRKKTLIIVVVIAAIVAAALIIGGSGGYGGSSY
jgi:hypothetical protein